MLLPETTIRYAQHATLSDKTIINYSESTANSCFTFTKRINSHLVLKVPDGGMNLTLEDAKEYIGYINQWFKQYYGLKNVVVFRKNIWKLSPMEEKSLNKVPEKTLLYYFMQYKPFYNFATNAIFEFTPWANKRYSQSNQNHFKDCKIISTRKNGTLLVRAPAKGSNPSLFNVSYRALMHKKTQRSVCNYLLDNKIIYELTKGDLEQSLADIKALNEMSLLGIVINYNKFSAININKYNVGHLQLLLFSLVRPLLTAKYENIPIKLLHLKKILPNKDLFYLYGLLNYSQTYDSYYWIAPLTNVIFPSGAELVQLLERTENNERDTGYLHYFFNNNPNYVLDAKERKILAETRTALYYIYKNNNISLTPLIQTTKSLWITLNQLYERGSKEHAITLKAVNTDRTQFLTLGAVYKATFIKNKMVKIISDDYVYRVYRINRFKIL